MCEQAGQLGTDLMYPVHHGSASEPRHNHVEDGQIDLIDMFLENP